MLHAPNMEALLSIDSTTIAIWKTSLPWTIYHSERSGIKLHVSFTNETAMPLQVVETTGGLKHGDLVGESLEDACFILVCDRAHFSIEEADRYLQEKQQHSVLRVKDNIQLNRKKSLKGCRTMDSRVISYFTCTLGNIAKTNKETSLYRTIYSS